jgi:FtsP/CotA-like multicopper oxidase with cupredoxin domain
MGLAGLLFTKQCDALTPGTCLVKVSGGLIPGLLSLPIADDPRDESALRPELIGPQATRLDDGFHLYHGALEGGQTGTETDVSASLATSNLLPGENSFDMPSGGIPSPLFGASAFSQKMLQFEEFGIEDLKASASEALLPKPGSSSVSNDPEMSPNPMHNSPQGTELESFLGEPGLYPMPTREANTELSNPWWDEVCDYLNRIVCGDGGPIEGRPPGQGWAHQRWQEFAPQKSFKTAQAGARTNLGFRDKRQMHGYSLGEFGPGGLYHNTTGLPGFDGTTRGLKIRFHPLMPVQDHNSVWTFDGTLPPKLLMVRYGESVLMRHFNALPIDVSANRGFGLHTITTHEHNGHNPAESDGYAGAFFFPGQFFDYRWPIALAGHDTINTNAIDPKASTPCTAGEVVDVPRTNGEVEAVPCDTSRDPSGQKGIVKIRGDYREVASTHWFHDHMLDFTAQNVYKGNSAMMNYYSAIDRGNESLEDGINLRFPSGSQLSWGNRDYDMNLVIADKAWDQSGQLWFNPFNRNGFLGDMMTVNFQYKPYVDVRARRYRFRLLNGAVARYLKLALVREIPNRTGLLKGPVGQNVSYETVPFHMIGNDGNILEHSVAMDGKLGTQNGILPTQSIAERYDVIVDFAKNNIKPGDRLYFVNLLEHKDGRRPGAVIPLASVLNGTYRSERQGTRYLNGDPGVGTFLQFRVQSCNGGLCRDPSMDPARFVSGNRNGSGGTALKMVPRPSFSAQELAEARHRTFKFGLSSGTASSPWTVATDNGAAHTADLRRISAAPNLGNINEYGQSRVEIWHLEGGVGGWSHPVHIHFEEGQILSRKGMAVPEWERWARKDMFRIGHEQDSSPSVSVAFRFREFSGSYVEHCHNTTHEDHAMLVRWDIEKPGQTLLMPSPVPSWDGVHYISSVAESSFRTGGSTP